MAHDFGYYGLRNIELSCRRSSTQVSPPASGGKVRLQIFDVAGRLVRTLVDGMETPGEKRVTWDGRNSRGSHVATGVYFYRMDAPGFTKTRKMVLLK